MTTPPRLADPDRARLFDALEDGIFDLAVIGGGITGAGVARDAALRGLRVALLEAGDFASGTSSRSSKLIHGGLRYLAQGEVGLVRETALERKRVHAMAPHLAEPCWMLVPARSRAGILKFRAGLATYEKLGAVAEADRHRVWSGAELAAEEPHLDRDRTPYACAYREYLTDDARLVIANLRAASALGARAANHAPVVRLVVEGGRAVGVVARCTETGREAQVRARAVVNAAGPWVESVGRLEDPAAPPRLHLSKGVHVVLPRARLPVHHLVILGAADRRSIFVIPRGGVVYVGTTDTSFGERPDGWPPITTEDVAYLLEPVARTFDVGPLGPDDCVSAWSGLRPLVAQAGKAPTEISRKDEVTIGPAGMVTIAGGKLTGYRKMAISVVEKVGGLIGGVPERPEEDPPLPGGDFAGELGALARRLADATGVPAETAQRLARLHGAEGTSVVACGPAPLFDGATVLAGEVDWAVANEAARCVEDVVYRRTAAAWFLPHEREALVVPVADRMAALLGWSPERTRDERDRARERLRRDVEFAHRAASPASAQAEGGDER